MAIISSIIANMTTLLQSSLLWLYNVHMTVCSLLTFNVSLALTEKQQQIIIILVKLWQLCVVFSFSFYICKLLLFFLLLLLISVIILVRSRYPYAYWNHFISVFGIFLLAKLDKQYHKCRLLNVYFFFFYSFCLLLIFPCGNFVFFILFTYIHKYLLQVLHVCQIALICYNFHIWTELNRVHKNLKLIFVLFFLRPDFCYCHKRHYSFRFISKNKGIYFFKKLIYRKLLRLFEMTNFDLINGNFTELKYCF